MTAFIADPNQPTGPDAVPGSSETAAGQAGKVYLIGAGPGDAELITVKGLRYLRSADVVLYDRLISPALLQETRAGATLIYVGKGAGCHTMPQEQINAELVEQAQRGHTVARLKGGDPFVFGRGGEEAQALAEANIPFEIVPGITSAIAVPAYAGIPVTHRDFTTSFTVVTGHESPSASPSVNWEALAALGGTLVVLMGVKALPNFTQKLIQGGIDPATPAAVIQEGTTDEQRVVTATVATIAAEAQAAGLSAPALTIIGTVVNVRETLVWYHQTHP
ncbi:uroporphyrinogen-III C-methyltransferase [Dictyobacter arantiisoli]|uniref:uroporphyrinogen-III C-methyltransferase n=1 Tax=Dictyobacter arantiisoli TaxID=2014874 RepID=A0A5A5TGS9_9CHLR|nr:uroporphyrinogen-III C-methyltransferase [Dictyobacter arantiisoli]GCF10522.1 uroporphyrin-III C-methyltransferase [Dictyobacter arantiisoli]